MSMDNPTGHSDNLSDNLTALHRALLAGDFRALTGLTHQIERHLDGGATKGLDAAALAGLRRLADENAILLRAAQRGLRAAQRRIAEIRGVATGLTTYTAGGQRRTSASASGPDHRV